MNKSEQRAIDILERAFKNNRLHHAILLYGPSLKSLEEIAKHISNKILDCESCIKHPDFFTLRPEGKARQIKIGSLGDKTGGQWPINTMRWLLNELRQTSNMGGNKVALVYEADRMNAQAANAFLKTLEEPPSGTSIFLLSERPNDLLDTIKSRCISVRIESEPVQIENEDWAIWLDDFENWLKKTASDISLKEKGSECVLECYGLLSRFDAALESFSKESSSLTEEATADMDEEMIEAIESSERKNLRKNLLSQIENRILQSASSGKISITKIGRCVEILERSTSLMELNMKDVVAFESFMLNALRILSAKDK